MEDDGSAATVIKQKNVDESINENATIANKSALDAADETVTSSPLGDEQNDHIDVVNINDDHAVDEMLQNSDEQVGAIQFNSPSHVLNLVEHAIGQWDADTQPNIMINEADNHSKSAVFEVQAEVVVTTTQDEQPTVADKQSKRKANPKEEVKNFMKRRRSMDVRIISHSGKQLNLVKCIMEFLNIFFFSNRHEFIKS